MRIFIPKTPFKGDVKMDLLIMDCSCFGNGNSWKFVVTTCHLRSVSSGGAAGGCRAGAATAGRRITDLSPEDGHQFFNLSGLTVRAGQFLCIPRREAEILKFVAALLTVEFINRHGRNLKFILIFLGKGKLITDCL
jgi:hypothetical protein